MFKRFIIIILLFVLLCKIVLSYSNVFPDKSVNFIKDYFNYNDIADIQKLIYKVVFNNGIWNEIDRNSLKIPTNFIDKKVISRVNPNEAIIKIIKKCNMYVISLDNYKFCRNANLTENT